MVIGEAPGAQEDQQGRPFVGASGKVLDRWLAEAGVRSVYITNLVKCRPPKNAGPKAAWTAACRRHLDAEIDEVQPRLIVCIGRHAGNALLDTNATASELTACNHRHTLPDGSGTPLVVLYHPAFYLYGGGRTSGLTLEQNIEALRQGLRRAGL